MKIDPDSKIIFSILPQGSGTDLVGRLSEVKGIHSANVSSGRGLSSGTVGSIGGWGEVDMLSVVVPADRADEIFSFIYFEGRLDQQRGGIIYQHAVSPVTEFKLPEV